MRDDGINRIGLDEAVCQLTRAYGDESRRLPEVLHHLVRAIPALDPLVALLERETGRRLRP